MFSESLVSEVNAESELSRDLMDMKEETLESTLSLIRNSMLVRSRQKLTQFVGALLLAVKFRPRNIELYARLVSRLTSEPIESDTFLSELKSTIQRALFSRDSVKTAHVLFLYKCVNEKVFEVNDVLNRVLEYEKLSPASTNHALHFFAWFLPEFELELHDDFIRLFALLKKSNSPVLKNLQKDLLRYQSECWHEYEELRASGYNHHAIARVLRSDDVDTLKSMFDENKVDLESEIESSFFEREELLHGNPKCIQYAAYYGSVNCFNFLISHLARADVYDRNHNSTAAFGCAGGNSEILFKLRDLGVDFSTSPQIAVLFHQNKIYEWILTLVDHDNFAEKIRPVVFQKALISNNLPICLSYLGEGVNFNETNVCFEFKKYLSFS